ncbi:MAG TPA: putative 2OG-Fe(II) oxygenase [Frateuria sp.]|uniref:putative 2OG-Fe(II) oxygenase n=1 Tax=Frateuria sp. TaxID=2211372 RepID=UPI002D7FAEB8|nr:putative 2OG-Fe(II) oxygenase [Frateuria sp.]HET6805078.1 putative 2OG-Fe(II) oxygenase [Frateuria sp.]
MTHLQDAGWPRVDEGGQRSADIAGSLCRAAQLASSGRAREALDLLDTQPPPADAERLRLRARCLLALGRPDAAATSLRELLALAPAEGDAWLALAVAAGQCGLPGEAASHAQQAIELGADPVAAGMTLARALFEVGRYGASEDAFREVLRLAPGYSAAHAALVELIWMRTGDLEDAVGAGGAAAPDSSLDVQLAHARSLLQAGATAAAARCLEALVGRYPQHVPLLLLTAQALVESRPEAACRLTARAVGLAPRSRPAVGLHGVALLASGKVREAAALAERLLATSPGDIQANALRATAWRLLGDERYAAQYDYARRVTRATIEAPTGWASLESYLADLAGCLHELHRGLVAAPLGQSVRGGTQVELHPHRAGVAEPIRVFPDAIAPVVREHLRRLAASEPGMDGGGAYRFDGLWTVRLGSQGYHAHHFHGRGWISSACHIEVPRMSGGERAGWLAFGASGYPTPRPVEAEHWVEPVPGRLTLFPSWMWHGTEAFRSEPGANRLSVAFDIVPG